MGIVILQRALNNGPSTDIGDVMELCHLLGNLTESQMK